MLAHKNAPVSAVAKRARNIGTALLLTTVLAGTVLPSAVAAQDLRRTQNTYAIKAQSVSAGLIKFSQASGMQVFVDERVAAKIQGNAVSGTFSADTALNQLLSGSGLTMKYLGKNTVTIVSASVDDMSFQTEDGSLMLDAIVVTGTQAGTKAAIYQQAAPTAVITSQEINRFRGSNAADMFRGTAGVMSGDSRNSGSGLDMNIRGMQGMERVKVTIDGAMNNTTIYQGYQGISNRSYVDPDFIAGIEITKGADASSRGIAGTVAMRTIEASDIVKPGSNWGARIKTEIGGNTSTPVAGDRSGYFVDNNPTHIIDPVVLSPAQASYFITALGGTLPADVTDVNALQLALASAAVGVLYGFSNYVVAGADFIQPPPNESFATSSNVTMNQPSLTSPTQGSASTAVAYMDEDFELLVGWAHRKRGNYHAGSHGQEGASVSNLGTQPFCFGGTCYPLDEVYVGTYYQLNGSSNYRDGEQVLNTQLESTSMLAKATYKFGNGHAVQLGFNSFSSEAGDKLASRLSSGRGQALQEAQTIGTNLRTFTLKHRWQPAGNDLIDLKANIWHTKLERRNKVRLGSQTYAPSDFGLPDDYRVGTDNIMFGLDITNTSYLRTKYGELDLTYGLSHLHQDTRPSAYSAELDGIGLRDGKRDETAAFIKADLEINDWISVNAGLRFQHYESLDRSPTLNSSDSQSHGQALSGSGWSPSLGLVLEPYKDTQVYVSYSSAQRLPSLYESLTGFSTRFNGNLQPERASNWEIGTNITRNDLFASGDTGMLKFGYFNWNVENYLSREWTTYERNGTTYPILYVYNTDRVKFEGLELSAQYEHKGFNLNLSANYYLNVEFCKTANTCDTKSLYAGYATNQIPPEYTISLDASQKFYNDRLTVGGRVEYVSARAIGHGDIAGQGASAFITLVDWQPYTLIDVFAEYQFSENLHGTIRVENLTDQYYVDPLSLVVQPGPGRAIYLGLTATF